MDASTQLDLFRKPSTPHSTPGDLSLNGVFQCHTLEDVVRPDGVKVFGETAIPHGVWPLTLRYSPHFEREMIHIEPIPNFTDVMIHNGNTDAQTLGCILVGQTESLDWVGNSKAALAALERKLIPLLKAGEAIHLTIHPAGA